MNYLELLPINIHEEIAKRLEINEPYNLDIYENILIFYKHKIPDDICTAMKKKRLYTLNYHIRFRITKLSLLDKVFYAYNSNMKKGFFFNGNQKIYFCSGDDDAINADYPMYASHIINITSQANNDLLNKLEQLRNCIYCNEDITDGHSIFLSNEICGKKLDKGFGWHWTKYGPCKFLVHNEKCLDKSKYQYDHNLYDFLSNNDLDGTYINKNCLKCKEVAQKLNILN
jgi:hypothetical protein